MSRLHVISFSTRPFSNGRPLALWITELARSRGDVETTLIDLRDVALPFLDEPRLPADGNYAHQHTKDWSATIGAADAFIFVMPMYNGGFTAPLKNALDSLFREWEGKPVGLISYSSGPSGGAPAVEMIRPVLGRLKLRVANETLSIPDIEAYIGADRTVQATTALTADVAAVAELLDVRSADAAVVSAL